MVKPLYNKALYTLECLMEQLMVPHVFDKIALKSVSVENTLRFLIRCKMMFNARALMLEILARVFEREDVLDRMKTIVMNIREENEMNDPELRERLDMYAGQLTQLTAEVIRFVIRFLNEFIISQQSSRLWFISWFTIDFSSLS